MAGDQFGASCLKLNQADALELRWDEHDLTVVCFHGIKTFEDDSMEVRYGPREFSRMVDRQRKQARGLMEFLGNVPGPAIVGGDFNAPPSAPLLRILGGPLGNSFDGAGRGLGLTFPANFPVLRIDQILFSPDLVARSCDTMHLGSDHLAVISEFEWADRKGEAQPKPAH